MIQPYQHCKHGRTSHILVTACAVVIDHGQKMLTFESPVFTVRVRVRPLDEIARTLDEQGKTGGIKFVKEHMAEFCNREFRVGKAVEGFYDEQRRIGLRLGNAYVLQATHCSGVQPEKAQRCKRACNYIRHKHWLDFLGWSRRAPGSSNPVPDSLARRCCVGPVLLRSHGQPAPLPSFVEIGTQFSQNSPDG